MLFKKYIPRSTLFKLLDFNIDPDKQFERYFLNIIGHSAKDNTYKFALARFLLDYSRTDGPPHVDFITIAKYFLKYYWIQVCKLKMKHAPQATKKPEIVTIIEKEFTKPYYPQTFNEIDMQEPEKIRRCVDLITKRCFHNVIWRFQRIKVPEATEVLFFNYRIDREVHANRKYIDLDYGINLYPEAVKFFQRRNTVLMKAVILEWSKFLEKLNIGLPKIIAKTEGKNASRRSLARYKRLLKPFFDNCFYCKKPLPAGRATHVEHVIPFDYIAEDDIWNLTLVCQQCNLRKLGALPPMEYIYKLIERNKDYRTKIPLIEKSLARLDPVFGETIKKHYANAESHGYMPLKKFP